MSGVGGATTLESALLRDRLWVAGGLIAAVALSWIWLVPAALDMQGDMNGPAAWMMVSIWDARYFLLIFAMWVVMMAGMMLPSAAPTLLLFARVVRSGPSPDAPVPRVYAFATGYLLAWSGFSLAATTLQWGLSKAQLLTPMMQSGSAELSGALLIAAGAYQWTPFKLGCLARCRSPAAFIATQFKPGIPGALRMGLEHGLHCLGCCWVLMLLLFVGGVMSLLWIAAITIFVLLEKLAPFGVQSGKLSGLLLVGAGSWLLIWG